MIGIGFFGSISFSLHECQSSRKETCMYAPTYSRLQHLCLPVSHPTAAHSNVILNQYETKKLL